jgi:error-prone DNA polymerase
MFLLFEDEFGTINLIVAKDVYERHRLLARAEPLLLAHGRLERSQEQATVRPLRASERQEEGREEIRPVINVIVRELAPLDGFLDGGIEERSAQASVHRLPGSWRPGSAQGEEELQGTEVGSSMRGAAPPVQSFAMGRRR